MSTTKRRRNRQPLEKILELARAKVVETVSEAVSGECARSHSYWSGVVHSLEHALGIQEHFTLEPKKTVTYELAVR